MFRALRHLTRRRHRKLQRARVVGGKGGGGGEIRRGCGGRVAAAFQDYFNQNSAPYQHQYPHHTTALNSHHNTLPQHIRPQPQQTIIHPYSTQPPQHITTTSATTTTYHNNHNHSTTHPSITKTTTHLNHRTPQPP